MPPVLALYEDVLSDGAALALAAAARMIFLVHGGVTVVGRALHDGETWHGEGAAALVAGSTGATCWRFELDAPPAGAAPGVTSREKLAAPLATLPADELLLRGDSVAFPPGGKVASGADSFSRELTPGAAPAGGASSSKRQQVAPVLPATSAAAPSPCQASPSCNARPTTVTPPCTRKIMRAAAGSASAAPSANTSS